MPNYTKESLYFSNEIVINEFSKNIISDLAFFKRVIRDLKELNIDILELEKLEHDAFNLLIDKIELEKGNSRVEVGIIGSFSSGKSTFINSLFKKPICPMSVEPTTSSITKFYYGYQEQITLNGKVISKSEYQHISKHNRGDISNSKTYYIEYAYPFESFNSIILYDTPGFNNRLNSNDTSVTMKTLNSVDVLFFVVDIAKGDIDKSSMDIIETLKDKRLYCILNKADTKSKEALKRIRESIEAKKIFLEVIEYSALKVLEHGTQRYFDAILDKIESRYIPNQEEFLVAINGYNNRIEGRVETQNEYCLTIDGVKYRIDNYYSEAKFQRKKIENLLYRVAKSREFTLKQSLKFKNAQYNHLLIKTIETILERLESTIKIDSFSSFDRDVERFKKELFEFEKRHKESFYRELKRAFIDSCTIFQDEDEVNKKKIWQKPSFKISFNRDIFKEKVNSIEFIEFFNLFRDKWVSFFQVEYNITLDRVDGYIIYMDSLDLYSNSINEIENISFIEKEEAKEYLNKIYNIKENISIIYDFIEKNSNKIDRLKIEIYSSDRFYNSKVDILKGELSQFLMEKKSA